MFKIKSYDIIKLITEAFQKETLSDRDKASVCKEDSMEYQENDPFVEKKQDRSEKIENIHKEGGAHVKLQNNIFEGALDLENTDETGTLAKTDVINVTVKKDANIRNVNQLENCTKAAMLKSMLSFQNVKDSLIGQDLNLTTNILLGVNNKISYSDLAKLEEDAEDNLVKNKTIFEKVIIPTLQQLSQNSAFPEKATIEMNISNSSVAGSINIHPHLHFSPLKMQKFPLLEQLEIAKKSKKSAVWNLPRQDNGFIGRKELLKELQEKIHTQSLFASNCQPQIKYPINVLVGMPGVGRRELAKEYILKSQGFYPLRAWFSAESADQLKREFIEFAKALGFQGLPSSEKEYINYIKQVLLEYPGALLVYANTNTYNEVKDFLLDDVAYIILTTQIDSWPSSFKKTKVLIMDKEKEDATNLVKHLIGREIEKAEENEIKRLAESLGYLPIALVQAGAYIKKHPKMSIEDYNLELLLADDTLPVEADVLPIVKTWNITLSSIIEQAKKEQKPPFALEILIACAYLSPEKISREMLYDWFNIIHPDLSDLRSILDKHIEQLSEYSIIDSDGENFISIHGLVQTIIRSFYQKTTKQNNTGLPKFPILYLSLYVLFSDNFNREIERNKINSFALYDYLVEANEKKILSLFPHVQTLEQHLFTFFNRDKPSTVRGYAEEFVMYKPLAWGFRFSQPEVLNAIGYVILNFNGDPESAKIYFQNSVQLAEKFYFKDKEKITAALNSLGFCMMQTKEKSEAVVVFKKVLEICEKKYGKYDVKIIEPLINLSIAYFNSGNLKNAKDTLEHARKIQQYYDIKEFKKINELEKKGFINLIVGHEYNFDNSGTILTYLGKIYAIFGNGQESKLSLVLAEAVLSIGLRLMTIRYELLKDTWSFDTNAHYFRTPKVLDMLGTIYIQLGEFEKARKLLEISLSRKRRLAKTAKVHTSEIATLILLGTAHKKLGNTKKSKEILEEVMAFYNEYQGTYYPDELNVLTELACVYIDLGNPEKAKEILEDVLKITAKYNYKENDIQLAIVFNYFALAYRDLEDANNQKIFAKRALKIFAHYDNRSSVIKIPQFNELVTSPNNDYVKSIDKDDTDEILDSFTNLEESEILTNEKHNKEETTVLYTNNLLDSLNENYVKPIDKNDTDEILGSFTNLEESETLTNEKHNISYEQKQNQIIIENNKEKAIVSSVKEVYGIESSDVATSLTILADAHIALQEAKQAIVLLERALKIYEYHYGKNHINSAMTLIALGDANRSLGILEQSRIFLEIALEIQQKYYGNEHCSVARTSYKLAQTYFELNNMEKTSSLAYSAYNTFSKEYGLEHLFTKKCAALCHDASLDVSLKESIHSIQENLNNVNNDEQKVNNDNSVQPLLFSPKAIKANRENINHPESEIIFEVLGVTEEVKSEINGIKNFKRLVNKIKSRLETRCGKSW